MSPPRDVDDRIARAGDRIMTLAPKVSVIMSVHNGLPYLREAIDSVLTQSFSDFEFLIVNDSSNDASRECILSAPDNRIRLLDNSSCVGLTRSLNLALAQAQGELIARQDADDVCAPNRFELQVAAFDASPELVLLGSQVELIDEKGRTRNIPGWDRAQTELGLRWQLLFDSPFVHSTAMFRRSVVWDQLGGYNEDFAKSQDYELWSRVVSRYPVANHPAKLSKHRLHASSVSRSYGTENIRRTQTVMADNMSLYCSDRRLTMSWAGLWLSLMTPYLGQVVADPDELATAVDSLTTGFCAAYPQAADLGEINTQTASVLSRGAVTAMQSNWRAAARLWAKALRTDRRQALAFSTRLAKSFLMSMLVRR